MITQKDKQVTVQNILIVTIEQHRINEKVFKLAWMLTPHGLTNKNERMYHLLDKEITTTALAAAKRVGRKKCGYIRNNELAPQEAR